MAAGEASINIHDHGTALNEKKNRVQCNYCGKVVSGFSRLKCHLGGIRGDVTPCEKVPENVKELLRSRLLETKRGSLCKEVGRLYHPDLPLKRKCCPNSNSVKHIKCEATDCGSGRHAEMDPVSEESVTEHVLLPSRRKGSQAAVNGEEMIDLATRKAKKFIGRFFYESGIDFSAVNSPSFKRMINPDLGHGQEKSKIPSCQELKGWILQDEVREMREHVKKIKHSWASTGCSILLDGWIDEKGRDLISFVVNCPQGPIYLRSSDVSAFVGDVDALQLFLDGVIEEVGVNNVVQIVACSTMGWMGAVSKQFMDRRRTVFWTVSASHCIGLMLEKIEMMDSIRGVLDNAKTISKFIHGHATVLDLFRHYSDEDDLVKPHKVRSAMPFMTLENIVSKKKNLKEMFVSSEWNTSIWASIMEGKRVTDLVGDSSFWNRAEMVLKATVPLVRVLCLISGADKPQVGDIYETMDQVKETIKKEFKSKKSQYMPFWKVIDEIWDTYLHSPLHAAGYYLNPSLFYSSDFYTDTEVSFGLLCCIVRMVQDQCTQDLISIQLDEYRHGKGSFHQGSTADEITKFTPAQWWSHYGTQYPELQRFAIRILSQTCDGASKYGLQRTLAEKILTKGRNRIEQQRLSDLTVVHYNLHLQNSQLGHGIVADDIDPMDDWIVDEAPDIVPENGGTDVDRTEGVINREEPSLFQAKEEPS